MTETAPERIWATRGEVYGAVELGQWADTVRHKGGKEYVDADLLDDAVKALAQVLYLYDVIELAEAEPPAMTKAVNDARATIAKLRSKTNAKS